MRLLNLVAGAVMALGLLSAAASAATVDFRTVIVGGVNLGTASVARLVANQDGADVVFTLTNNVTNPPTSFLSKLYLTFTGNRAPVSRVDVSGVASSHFFKGATIDGLAYQLQLTWHGADRLNGGESSTFRLLNVSMADLFQGVEFSRVQIRGLPNNGVAKYSGTLAPVPVPAAGLLLLGALGGLALMRRRKAA